MSILQDLSLGGCIMYFVKRITVKRMMAALTAVIMTAALSSCGSSDSSSSSSSPSDVQDSSAVDLSASTNSSEVDDVVENGTVMSAENVKLVGRTYVKDNTLWLALSGSGARFTYTGRKLDITVQGDNTAVMGQSDNQARVAVYVDGERVVDRMIDAPEVTLNVLDSQEVKTSEIQIVKLSECAQSVCGIKPVQLAEGESIVPAADKEHRIEFIGDSITCGYGVDDEVKEHHFSTKTEDVTKAYAYKTAAKLGADYSIFSISGYGIISGYSDGKNPVPEQTIPQYYGSVGFSYNTFADGTKPQDVEWDFDVFKPEVIVINLGTNDASYTGSKKERKEEYKEGYLAFIKQVREKNPDAEIFCGLGIMGNTLFEAMGEAVGEYIKETGDKKVHLVKFDVQNGNVDGYAADWHPTEATHEKASDALAAEIKEVMGW